MHNRIQITANLASSNLLNANEITASQLNLYTFMLAYSKMIA